MANKLVKHIDGDGNEYFWKKKFNFNKFFISFGKQLFGFQAVVVIQMVKILWLLWNQSTIFHFFLVHFKNVSRIYVMKWSKQTGKYGCEKIVCRFSPVVVVVVIVWIIRWFDYDEDVFVFRCYYDDDVFLIRLFSLGPYISSACDFSLLLWTLNVLARNKN